MIRTNTNKEKTHKGESPKQSELTDESIMPFGMFKGKALANVENSYLRWFYEQNFGRKVFGFNQLLMKYIEDNHQAIFTQK